MDQEEDGNGRVRGNGVRDELEGNWLSKGEVQYSSTVGMRVDMALNQR